MSKVYSKTLQAQKIRNCFSLSPSLYFSSSHRRDFQTARWFFATTLGRNLFVARCICKRAPDVFGDASFLVLIASPEQFLVVNPQNGTFIFASATVIANDIGRNASN